MSLMSDYESELRVVFGIVGTFVTAGCGFCPVMMVVDLVKGELESGGIGVGFVGAFFALGGIALLVLAFRGWGYEAKEKAERESRERQILEVARALDGEVTVSELTLETSYTMDEAEALLDDFVSRGAARLDISAEQGQKRYVFPGFKEDETFQETGDHELDALFEEMEREQQASRDASEVSHAEREPSDDWDVDTSSDGTPASSGEPHGDDRISFDEPEDETELALGDKRDDGQTSQTGPDEETEAVDSRTREMYAADLDDDTNG